ncbi:hypothetical protein [Sporosarcina obsidiansis]|uniref:hypothetical protein n=1 Tax=Sporosarcina obsidiansis TaxID=2660748 RepID=UPI00129A2DE7|nr:hypothetical protein [Sporosarcina obsidiansis]
MTTEKKKIIISEIQYWKKNKLLPEHYCDFLITLYTQGEELDEVSSKVPSTLQKERRQYRAKQMMILLISLLLAGIASVAMFMLTEYPTATLLSASVLALLLLVLASGKTFIKKGFAPFLYISMAFLILMMSLKIWTAFFNDETTLLIGLLVLNCSLWLFTGRLLKLLYFTISGSLGLLIIVGFLILSF